MPRAADRAFLATIVTGEFNVEAPGFFERLEAVAERWCEGDDAEMARLVDQAADAGYRAVVSLMAKDIGLEVTESMDSAAEVTALRAIVRARA